MTWAAIRRTNFTWKALIVRDETVIGICQHDHADPMSAWECASAGVRYMRRAA